MATEEGPSSDQNPQTAPTAKPDLSIPVDVTYNFVWTTVNGEDDQRNNIGSISIQNVIPALDEDRTKCLASFQWRGFEAEFSCLYHLCDDVFSDFKVKKRTMRGGMEKDVEEAKITFVEARDDNGNPFMRVELDFGYSGCVQQIAEVYGKKAVEGQGASNSTLSRDERRRLRISNSDWQKAF